MQNTMPLLALQPYIRVAHQYRFPSEKNMIESKRIGYCYALHLVSDGKGTLTVGEKNYPLKKGDLVFLPPTILHSFYSSPEQPFMAYNIYCELWTSSPQATPQHLVWNERDFNPSFLTKECKGTELDELPVIISLQHCRFLTELLPHILHQHQRAARQPGAHSLEGEITSRLLQSFLLELVQVNSDKRIPDYRIQRITEQIEKEATSGSQYGQWMEGSGLQKTQFHERFKQATGLSPKAYWTQTIMKQAAAALQESNRTITAVSEDLGYSSIHHFTKQFTAYYGVSPSEYRKRQT